MFKIKKNNLLIMDTCPICYDDLNEEKDNIITLKCGHKFHNNCILEEYKNNRDNQKNFYNIRICPYCRKDGGYLELKENIFPLKKIHKEWDIVNDEILKNENIITPLIKKYLNKNCCYAILKSGKNKGSQCKKKKNSNSNFCFIHNKYYLSS